VGHRNVKATLMPIAEAIYFAVTNSIMKGIVGNSCMVVASVRGRVFDQSPGQKRYSAYGGRAL